MVIGVTRVKNEQDIVAATVGRMIAHVDHVLVMDGSTDETTEILERLPVTLIRDETPTYAQPEQMTALAHMARDMGADWVVPFDGDEVWMATGGRMAKHLEELPAECLIAEAHLFNHVVTGWDDPDDSDPVSRIQWRRPQAVPLRKVAVRAREDLTIHFGQHGASFADVPHPLRVTDLLQVRHFPYRSIEQFIGKIRVGAPPLMTSGLDESIGAHWRGFGKALEEEGEQSLVDWFNRWAYSEDPEHDHEGLVHDPCPIPAP